MTDEATGEPAEAGAAEKILEAADGLLSEVGYEGASVAAVAKRAGVNKALVFYYYGSKAALFERVVQRYYAAHLLALSDALDTDTPLGPRMHQMVDAYLDFIAGNRRYPRLIQQLVAGSADHHAIIQKNLAPLFEWTRDALADVAPATGPLAARQLFVTFSGMVINYFTYAPVLAPLWGDDPMSEAGISERRAHLHVMVDLILGALPQAP